MQKHKDLWIKNFEDLNVQIKEKGTKDKNYMNETELKMNARILEKLA